MKNKREKLVPHFYRDEFACKCKCGFDTVDAALLALLIQVRNNFSAPVQITSGCRCKTYNSRVGGEPRSWHTKGRAADIVVVGINPQAVYDWLASQFTTMYGFGSYPTFTHIDSRRTPARWRG